nr:hypothetical protein B0A51_09707 [Rachicladosporium sp. CCFEE 5018]
MASLIFSVAALFQVPILLINAVAILSEDRFLARGTADPRPDSKTQVLIYIAVGWSNAQQASEPSFGGGSMQDTTSVKYKMINLINSVRTLMRLPLIGVNVVMMFFLFFL